MPIISKIHITDVDNELYILVSQSTVSMEICHIKSGYYNKSTDLVIYPSAILPEGNYDLILIGINWGGPQSFKVELTIDGKPVNYEYSAPAGSSIGVTWTKVVRVTVVPM